MARPWLPGSGPRNSLKSARSAVSPSRQWWRSFKLTHNIAERTDARLVFGHDYDVLEEPALRRDRVS